MQGFPRVWFATGLSCLPWVLLTACVEDPKVENDAPAQPGALEPKGGGNTVALAGACSRLTDAKEAARAKLECDAPGTEPSCSGALAVAGALPCDEYDEESVAACVTEIGQYAACSDFDTKPCVVAAIVTSCHPPQHEEAGTHAPSTLDGSSGADAADSATAEKDGRNSPSDGGTEAGTADAR